MSENYDLDAYYKGMDRFIDEFAKKANLDPISARICAVQTLRATECLKESARELEKLENVLKEVELHMILVHRLMKEDFLILRENVMLVRFLMT